MSRPWIHVQVDPVNHAGFVSGHGSRALIVSCGGKPQWSRRRKAWCTSESIALDVLALAEHEGYAVDYTQVTRFSSATDLDVGRDVG
jgi:hypothetical protein